MSTYEGEGRPGRKLTNQENTNPQEQGNSQRERAASNPLTPELQSWNKKPHQDLVKDFKTYVRQQEQQVGGAISPEEIVRSKFDLEAKSRWSDDEKVDEE